MLLLTERRDGILEFMLDYLRKTAKCSNCTTWKVRIELKTLKKIVVWKIETLGKF